VAEVLRRAGTPAAWRAHVKTARSTWGYRLLLDAGVTRFKCSTPQEARALLDAGAQDVLLAFPVLGPPPPRVGVLVDSAAAMATWGPGERDVFVDVDTGMHRTGVPVEETDRLVALAAAVVEGGHRLRGLHSYDGHLADRAPAERRAQVAADLRALAAAGRALEAAGLEIDEVVAGSTHTFTEVLAQPWDGPGERTVGPGTVLYNDSRALTRFGDDAAFAVAAHVLARVVSVEGDRVTADAGLTAAQVDAGRPHVHADGFEVVSVSQEHLVLRGTARVGDLLLLTPAHVDTAIVQFRTVHVVDGDTVEAVPAVPSR
jgi:D-serine deaminase-like pyridoxal phosphate-dependent protein